MREIKFRSAHYNHSDDKFQGFSYWGCFDLSCNQSEDSFAGKTTRSGTYRKGDEQFTGLWDKNGNPVYEGDIILLGDKTYDYRYESDDKVLVEWGNHTGFVPLQSWHRDYDPIYDFEIIGNIHEDPELL